MLLLLLLSSEVEYEFLCLAYDGLCTLSSVVCLCVLNLARRSKRAIGKRHSYYISLYHSAIAIVIMHKRTIRWQLPEKEQLEPSTIEIESVRVLRALSLAFCLAVSI